MKTKGADHPHGINAAYQLLCLCYIDSTMSVLQKMKFPTSSHLENSISKYKGRGEGGGNSNLAFDIINEHIYKPCMLRLFQTVKSLNILTLTAILDSMHITPRNNSRYLNLHSFIIKEYY